MGLLVHRKSIFEVERRRQDDSMLQLDKYPRCATKRFLELYMTLYLMAELKTPEHISILVLKRRRNLSAEKGGIIWHTQGSGKSLIMVWLANGSENNQMLV